MDLSHASSSPSVQQNEPYSQAYDDSPCGIGDYHDDVTPMSDDGAVMRSAVSPQLHCPATSATSSSASSRPSVAAATHRDQDGENKRFVSEMASAEQQGAKKFQEDSHFVFVSRDGSVMASGCFDGHGGKNGEVASRCAKRVATEFFHNSWRDCRDWKDEMWREQFVQLFAQIHARIREEFLHNPDAKKARGNVPVYVEKGTGIIRNRANNFPIHGGTTGTVVVVVFKPNGERYCVTTNVGDSDALICLSRATGTPVADTLIRSLSEAEHGPETPPEKPSTVAHLSVDHGPDSEIEFDRIQRLDNTQYPQKLLFIYDKPGSSFCKADCPRVFRDDGVKDPVYAKNPLAYGIHATNFRRDPAMYAVSPYEAPDVTCIAMTRSMGDFYAHQYGLSCEPDVSVCHLTPGCDYTIAVGSDGVWDCWAWEQFADYLHRGNASSSQVVHSSSTQQRPLQSSHFGSEQSTTTTVPRLPIQEFTTHVLKESFDRANHYFGSNAVDDASLILMRIGPNPPIVKDTRLTMASSSLPQYSPEPSPRAFVTDVAPVYVANASSSSISNSNSSSQSRGSSHLKHTNGQSH